MTVPAVIGGSQAELDFQQKMKERMRAAFGDLMPDETLAKIVAQGIEEAFFKERIVATDSWGRKDTEPSWCVKFMEAEAKALVAEAVKKWIAEHPEKFAEAVNAVISKGIASAFIATFDGILFDEMNRLKEGVAEAINKIRSSY